MAILYRPQCVNHSSLYPQGIIFHVKATCVLTRLGLWTKITLFKWYMHHGARHIGKWYDPKWRYDLGIVICVPVPSFIIYDEKRMYRIMNLIIPWCCSWDVVCEYSTWWKLYYEQQYSYISVIQLFTALSEVYLNHTMEWQDCYSVCWGMRLFNRIAGVTQYRCFNTFTT